MQYPRFAMLVVLILSFGLANSQDIYERDLDSYLEERDEPWWKHAEAFESSESSSEPEAVDGGFDD
jgi:hypothetical protein